MFRRPRIGRIFIAGLVSTVAVLAVGTGIVSAASQTVNGVTLTWNGNIQQTAYGTYRGAAWAIASESLYQIDATVSLWENCNGWEDDGSTTSYVYGGTYSDVSRSAGYCIGILCLCPVHHAENRAKSHWYDNYPAIAETRNHYYQLNFN